MEWPAAIHDEITAMGSVALSSDRITSRFLIENSDDVPDPKSLQTVALSC
jgi:hypothetical protein